MNLVAELVPFGSRQAVTAAAVVEVSLLEPVANGLGAAAQILSQLLPGAPTLVDEPARRCAELRGGARSRR